jgi:Family of unknown function (DUF6600)
MRILKVFLAAVLTAVSVRAQDAAPPAHISFVDGSAVVSHAFADSSPDARGTRPDSEPAVINMPIVQGDRIRTFAGGRVEVMFPDGAGIAIDPESEVEFISATRVRVLSGIIEHHAAEAIDPRSPSAQNLPPDLQTYGSSFDQNGSWQNEPTYGNVWYPTAVAADWRPYYDGYWSSYPSYGWTWIGYEPWAWPTHHYGRWGYARSRWFWIPGRSYGAAWVSWGTAPGYVSWCPLGYDSRPVVGLSAGFRNSWNAWTVIPRDHFGAHGYSVRRYAVEPQRIAASTAFIEHRTPPARAPHGSVSIADGGARRVNDNAALPSVGLAVPRSQYGGSAQQRATRDQQRTPASSQGTPVYAPSAATDQQRTTRDQRATRDPQRVTTYQQRATSNEQRATTSAQRATSSEQRATSHEQRATGDHPAYQPRYQPTYQAPRIEPVSREPHSNGADGRAAVPESRPTPQPRREAREVAAPAPAPRPASAPAASPAPAAPPPSAGNRPQQSSAPAREPNANGRGGGTQQGSSGGTAVRRPR